ncbi:hypothetical protein [Janibacter melonis]|nr:hypothetical protein [Janibacter melonis]
MPEDPTAGQVAVWQASRRAYHQRYAVPVEGWGFEQLDARLPPSPQSWA